MSLVSSVSVDARVCLISLILMATSVVVLVPYICVIDKTVSMNVKQFHIFMMWLLFEMRG